MTASLRTAFFGSSSALESSLTTVDLYRCSTSRIKIFGRIPRYCRAAIRTRYTIKSQLSAKRLKEEKPILLMA